MINRITQHVHQRISQPLQHFTVDLDFAAFNEQIDLLIGCPGRLPNTALKSRDNCIDRLHAGLHDRCLQFILHVLQGCQRTLQTGQLSTHLL